MAKYPVKMLKDEQNQPFVPLVSAESIYTNDDLSFEEKFATKLEADNLKEGNGIILEQNGNDTTISVDFGATDNIIDNLNTTVAGQGPLDARQGNVLKNMIPTIVDNLDSTDATKVLSANQGHELKEMSVPTGGATGQVLKKASNNDHELEWGDAADPNAIVGDGSIMKIIELTYTEYKTLESNGELREDTEYHITDLSTSEGGLSRSITFPRDLWWDDNVFGINMNNSDIVGINGLYWGDVTEQGQEGINFLRTDGNYDSLYGKDGKLIWSPGRALTDTSRSTDIEVVTTKGAAMSGPLTYQPGGIGTHFLSTHELYDGMISYGTGGNEAMVFSTKNDITSFMFVNGEDMATNYSAERWKVLSPGLQVKENKVAIAKLIPHEGHLDFPLEVNGIAYASGGLIGGDGGTVGAITIRTEHDNEINFGGTNTSDVIFFGYRQKDAKPVPILYTFGANGAARLKASGYDTSSLRACKENITQANINALDIINNTVITKFNFIADKNKEDRIGFIADDTHELLSGTDHDKMDLNNCIGVLMKAVQELSAEITSIKEKIKEE